MKKFTLAFACLLVGFAAGAVVAGPFGIFGNRGSCANGQCSTVAETVTTYKQVPTPAVRTTPPILAKKELPVQSVMITPTVVRYEATPLPTITNTMIPMDNSLIEEPMEEKEVFTAASGPVVTVMTAPARGAVRAVRYVAPGRRVARFGARLLPRNWCRR